jgi:hypothetical protein
MRAHLYGLIAAVGLATINSTDAIAAAQQAPAALRIVVVEGEDAVNVIQQKTAVRPVVEVRDRNNLPVSGALVTFSIEGGKAASFGGASTLTVATNAAGQAAVTGLTPATAGAFQIQVSAAFQGQIATATIAQTNVVTAAAATGAGASGATGAPGTSGATGATGAAGGGLSATTLGIVGAAVGGGALVATQAARGGGDTYSGSFSGQRTTITVGSLPNGGRFSCTLTRSLSGTATLTLDIDGDRVSGLLEATGTERVTGGTCSLPPVLTNSIEDEYRVSGTTSAFGVRATHNETLPALNDPRIVRQQTTSVVFEASLSGDTVTGRGTFEERATTTGDPGGPIDETGSGTFDVTLRKQ